MTVAILLLLLLAGMAPAAVAAEDGNSASNVTTVPVTTAPGATVPGTSAPVAASDEADKLTWSVRPAPSTDKKDRPNFQYELKAGATVRDSFRVRNYGKAELTLAIYSSDAVLTENGSLDLLPASERPTGVGTWVKLSADELTIPSGKFVDVPFTMTVPAMAESGDHSGGIVTSIVTRSADNGGQPVILDRRLGSRIQVRVTGDVVPSVQIQDLEVDYLGSANPLRSGSLDVGYRIANAGNVRMAVDPVIEVRGPGGLLGQKVVLERTAELLPGTSLDYRVKVPGIWPTMRPTVTLKLTPIPTRDGDSFPEGFVVTATKKVSAVPVSLLSTVAIAGAAPALWWRRRLRVRNNVDEKVRVAVEAALAAQAAQAAQTGDGSVAAGAIDRA